MAIGFANFGYEIFSHFLLTIYIIEENHKSIVSGYLLIWQVFSLGIFLALVYLSGIGTVGGGAWEHGPSPNNKNVGIITRPLASWCWVVPPQ